LSPSKHRPPTPFHCEIKTDKAVGYGTAATVDALQSVLEDDACGQWLAAPNQVKKKLFIGCCCCHNVCCPCNCGCDAHSPELVDSSLTQYLCLFLPQNEKLDKPKK